MPPREPKIEAQVTGFSTSIQSLKPQNVLGRAKRQIKYPKRFEESVRIGTATYQGISQQCEDGEAAKIHTKLVNDQSTVH